MHKLLLISGLSLCAAQAQAADQVACHYTYGGETKTLVTTPTASSYVVEPIAVGSYFLFRIVFRQAPADLAGIKLYTYADRDEGPTIIHQASHPYPPPAATVHGFSGLNFVYEPVRDGELLYWCEVKEKP